VVDFDSVKDSGKRQQFETGSQRDADDGKGHPSLVAWEVFLKVKQYKNIFPTLSKEDSILEEIESVLWRYSIPSYTRAFIVH